MSYIKALDRVTKDRHPGSFSLLHFQDGILSCLYRVSAPKETKRAESNLEDSDYDEREPNQSGWLIVFNVARKVMVLSKHLESTKNIFARHNARYLYYGFRELDQFEKRYRWALEGINLENTSVPLGSGNYCYLQDIDGFELGSTVCFEIIGGFFYAVTNQSTYRAQEIDWSSFYHCLRFPVKDPSRKRIEKTEDRNMWRRQHNEGPLDDRWSSLSIVIDESTGEPLILECRKELATGQRTAYKTKIVFPARYPGPAPPSDALAPLQASHTKITFKICGGSPREEEARKQELLSLTQDRVALTLEDHHAPRFLAPQHRLAANVHAEPLENTFTFSATPARSYNASSSCFVDLVNDLPAHDHTIKQCFRLRSCPRRPSVPPRDANGIIQFSPNDEKNCVYADGSPSFWPPQLSPYGQQEPAIRQLHDLLNPPSHPGRVTGTFDDTSLVYSVGKEGTFKALVFVNFDPSLKIPGLKRWKDVQKPAVAPNQYTQRALRLPKAKRVLGDSQPEIIDISSDESAAEDATHPQRKRLKNKASTDPNENPKEAAKSMICQTASDGGPSGLFSTEAALYLSIGQGFDFSC